MNKSLLVLGWGDSPETDKNRTRLVNYAQEAGFEVQAVDYHELGRLHRFKNETLNIMPFFPYTFWNKNCEIPDDTKLYGTSKRAYDLFADFLLDIQDKLETKFSTHNLLFTTPLASAALDRDKIQTLQILNGYGVSTSEMVAYERVQDILNQVTPERGVFIKCRYGAEGKGITLITPERWVTNYKVGGSRLTNYGVYDRWNFTDITGKKELLEQLIEQEVIVEREIVSPNLFGGKKFDVRVYVVSDEVPHFFVKINDLENVITNWSQGGKVIHHPETGLAENIIKNINTEAQKAASAFHSRLMGIDVMLDKDSDIPQVIELQAFTGFPDIQKFNLARYLVEGDFFQ
ncbi:MAG: YheC/YheD family protein [Nanoarchaeota archaeon]